MSGWGDFKLNIEYYIGAYDPRIQDLMDKARKDLDQSWWTRKERRASVQLAYIVGTRLKGQVRDKGPSGRKARRREPVAITIRGV